jgi:hypothetical protein
MVKVRLYRKPGRNVHRKAGRNNAKAGLVESEAGPAADEKQVPFDFAQRL